MCFWVPKLCASATIIRNCVRTRAIQYDHSVLSFNKTVVYIHDSDQIVILYKENQSDVLK